MDAHVRRALVDRRANPLVSAHAVADGVLDRERRELEALERRACRGDVDAQRAAWREIATPIDASSDRVYVALVAILAAANTPQDAARNTRFEISLVGAFERSGERDAAIGGLDVSKTEAREFGGQDRFESARTRREESLDHPVLSGCIKENRRVHPGDFHLSRLLDARLLCDFSAEVAVVASRP